MRKFVGMIFGVVVLLVAVGVSTSTPVAAQPQYSTTEQGSFQLIALHDWDRVCCKRGARDWWSTWRACRRAGGHRVANWQCRNDEYRICCKRGRRDWWSTPGQCRRSGGHQVAAWQCRNG
jgi:hypothetical protein